MKSVFTTDQKIEAFLVKSYLESHGIMAKVSGKQVFNVRQSALPQKVYVLEDSDFHRANELVKELNEDKEKIQLHLSDYWKCSQCSETHEIQFSSCWNCGTSRPN